MVINLSRYSKTINVKNYMMMKKLKNINNFKIGSRKINGRSKLKANLLRAKAQRSTIQLSYKIGRRGSTYYTI